MHRRRLLSLALTALAALAPAALFAQAYPAKPVTMVVPWPAGGSTDVGVAAVRPFVLAASAHD